MLVRPHPEAYDAVMAGQGAPRRRLIEGPLAGLRFVRNRIGDEADLAAFIEPSKAGPGEGHITGWKWRPVPEPELGSLPPPGQAWEMRCQAHQAHLSGHNIAERFGLAAEFLKLATAATPGHPHQCARRPLIPGGMGRRPRRRPMPGLRPGHYAVTACFWSLLVTWMLRGLAASWTGMVRVSTPAA